MGVSRLEWLKAAWESDLRRLDGIREAAWYFSQLSAVPQPGESPEAAAKEWERQDAEMLAVMAACEAGRAEIEPKLADLSLLVEGMRGGGGTVS
jgi:hypothetical protein